MAKTKGKIKKAGTKTIGGRKRQLYKGPKGGTFYYGKNKSKHYI